jgi:hypothetical protein
VDSLTEQMPEYYARMGFERTAKNGWTGEFTVSIRGTEDDWNMENLAAFTEQVRQRMLSEVATLNKITGVE